MKTRKCQWCKEHGNMEEMVIELTNSAKPVKKFYHKDCHEEFLKDKAFKEQEQKEKDELNDVIKKIYGVKEVPNSAWVLLEKLRGGNPVFGKQNIGKRYKEGYKYSLIKETFEYCSDTIEYWNGVKSFNGFMSAFRYALSIVIDKIYFVEQRAKQREKSAIAMKKHIEEIEQSSQEFEASYKKKDKAKKDISDFLDE